MMSRVSESSARTAVDIEIYAHKAAFEGQVLRTMLNGLQAKTNCKMSTETRIYASTVYEHRLFFYNREALRICVETEDGMKKAKEIIEEYRRMNKNTLTLNDLWKPLLVMKSDVLRANHLEGSIPRLSKLSDLWKKYSYNEMLNGLVISFVDSMIKKNIDLCRFYIEMIDNLIDWPPDIHPSNTEKISSEARDRIELFVRTEDKNIFVIDQTKYDEYLHYLVNLCIKSGPIDLVVSNEDEIRFISSSFHQIGINHSTVNQSYSMIDRSTVVIGTLQQHMERRFHDTVLSIIDKNRKLIIADASCMFNTKPESSLTVLSSELDINDVIIEIHNKLTISFEHLNELDNELSPLIVKNEIIPITLVRHIVSLWPTNSEIVLDAATIVYVLNKYKRDKFIDDSFLIKDDSWKHSLIKIIVDAIIKWTQKSEILSGNLLNEYVHKHGKELVYSALRARELHLGDDYTVHFDSINCNLSLVVNISERTEDSLGLKQFLELRHGCSLSSYSIPLIRQSQLQFVKTYDKINGLVCKNYYTYTNTATAEMYQAKLIVISPHRTHTRMYKVTGDASRWTSYIRKEMSYFGSCKTPTSHIIVCPSVSVLRDTYTSLQSSMKITVCETTVSLKDCPTDETCIVLTTRTAFEKWNRLPSSFKPSIIIVGNPDQDISTLSRAYRFAPDKVYNYNNSFSMNNTKESYVISSLIRLNEKSNENENIDSSRDSYIWCIEFMTNCIIDYPDYFKPFIFNAAKLEFALWIDSSPRDSQDWNIFCEKHRCRWSGDDRWPQWIINSIIAPILAGELFRHIVYSNWSSGVKLQAMIRSLIENKADPESLYYMCIINSSNDKNENSIDTLLKVKNAFNKRMRRWSKFLRLIHASREPIGIGLEKVYDSPRDVRCDGFIQNIMKKIRGLQHVLDLIGDLLTDMTNILPHSDRTRKVQLDLKRIARRNGVDVTVLERMLDNWGGGDFDELEKMIPPQWNAFSFMKYLQQNGLIKIRARVFALSCDCVSDATSILSNLQLFDMPDQYDKSLIQCSDRHLNDCTFYTPTNKGVRDVILSLEGASLEYFASLIDDRKLSINGNSYEQEIWEVINRSISKNTPLILLPRRQNEVLIEDLINSGIIICPSSFQTNGIDLNDNYDPYAIVRTSSACRGIAARFELQDLSQYGMHHPVTVSLSIRGGSKRNVWNSSDLTVYNTIYNSSLTPLINKSISSISRLLSIESSLMDYGTYEWMNWLSKRAIHTDIAPEIVNFYRNTLAERDANMKDEKIIKSIFDALMDANITPAHTAIDEIRLDSFANDIVEVLNRGERLIKIEPPLSSYKMADKLGEFIRSRRIPPSYNKV